LNSISSRQLIDALDFALPVAGEDSRLDLVDVLFELSDNFKVRVCERR